VYFATLFGIYFYPTLGITLQGVLMLAIGTFLAYAGSGDLRQTRNLSVPATVIACAATVAVIRSIFPVPEYLSPYFSYAIYLFPFTLIAAKLVQMSISSDE
jgi:hypothetical protein